MKAKVKSRKKRVPWRFKKISELFPSYAKFKKELDNSYKLSKKVPSKVSLQKMSSSGSDIPLPKNIDDAKLNLLCTNPKEIKYAWDVLMKYQQQEVAEKETKKEVIVEEPLISKEMKDGLLDLHDLIIDGTEAVANVKQAAVKNELKRVDQEKRYRVELDKLFLERDEKTKEELEAISAGWEGLKNLYNPLEIHRATNFLKEKCDDLLHSKDDMINYLKNELKTKDEKFVNELEKQGIEVDILIDRIEQQISILKDAYTKQLEKLEGMMDNEKEEIITNNRKIWEAIIKERDDIDRSAIDTIYKLVGDHEMKIDMDNIEQNEKQRALEIDLNNIIHKMTLELDRLRSMCALNIQKISYNYQLLLKRQTENQMIKNKNKRRILQLKNEIEIMKNKIQMETSTLAKEITEHVSAIDSLQQNIKEIEQRSAFLAAANSKQYFDMWDFNQKRAEELLHQIFAGDKALFEQVLYMPWRAPMEISFPKEVMPSYQEGLKICTRLKRTRLIKPKHEVTENEKEDSETLNLIKIIVKNMPSACSFFLDVQMKKEIEQFPVKDKLLLELENIFNALSINNKRDMQLLSKYFAKYITCPDCRNDNLSIHQVHKMVQTEDKKHLLSSLSKEPKKNDTMCSNECVYEGEKSESDESFMLTDQIKHNLKVIADTVFGEVHHSFCDHEVLHDMPNKCKSNNVEIDCAELNKEDIIQKHELFGMRSKEYPIEWFVSNINQSCFDNSNEEKEEEKRNDIPIVKGSEDLFRLCNDFTHQPYINPIDIAKAIKEFTIDFFNVNKMKKNKSLGELTSEMKVTLSRCLEEKDVENYWNSFIEIIPKEKNDLWDTMFTAMQDYYKALQKRHDLNAEIRKLKKSNFELRRLLQRYIENSVPEVEYMEYFKDLQQELSFEKESDDIS